MNRLLALILPARAFAWGRLDRTGRSGPLHAGSYPLPLWFHTKAECVDWIATYVVGTELETP